MEYNGLTFEYFKQCLEEIEGLYRLNDNVAHLLYDYGKAHSDYCEFYFPTLADTTIALLQLILRDKDDWISYWCYERNFGKQVNPGNVTGTDGTVYPFETPEHLWNLLAAERSKKGEV